MNSNFNIIHTYICYQINLFEVTSYDEGQGKPKGTGQRIDSGEGRSVEGLPPENEEGEGLQPDG